MEVSSQNRVHTITLEKQWSGLQEKNILVFLRPFLLEKTQHNWLVNKTINSSFKAYEKAR